MSEEGAITCASKLRVIWIRNETWVTVWPQSDARKPISNVCAYGLLRQGVYHVSLPAEVWFPVNQPLMVAIQAEFLIDQVPYTRFRLHSHRHAGTKSQLKRSRLTLPISCPSWCSSPVPMISARISRHRWERLIRQSEAGKCQNGVNFLRNSNLPKHRVSGPQLQVLITCSMRSSANLTFAFGH